MRTVTVTTEDLQTISDEGSVIVITGTDEDSGERVTFAGDHAPVSAMINGVLCSGSASAQPEDWQILRVSA